MLKINLPLELIRLFFDLYIKIFNKDFLKMKIILPYEYREFFK